MTGLDWGVILFYLLAVTAFGLWRGRGQKDTNDFLLGGRSIPWWAALFSLVATEISAATFLGAPEQGFRRDLTYLQFSIGTIAARFFLATFFIGVFYRAGVTTVYGYLTRRFGPGSNAVTAALFLFGRLLADGSRLFIAAIALQVATGLDMVTSIVVLGAITVLYTVLGGIKAVIWTDVAQGALLVGSGFILLGSLWQQVAQPAGTVWHTLGEAGKLRIFDTSPQWWTDPFNLVPAIIGGFFLTLATHGTDHDMVQRLLTCKDDAGSRRSMWMSGFVGLAVTVLFLAVGEMLYLYAQSHGVPDGMRADRVLLHYIVTGLPPGVTGLILAGVLAAAMSSLSSALSSTTATFISDFYRNYLVREAEPQHYLRAARVTTGIMGLLIAGVAVVILNFYRSNPDTDLLSIALGVMTLIYGAMLGIFLVGLFTRTRGNDRSNLVAALAGVSAVVFVKYWTALAWPWLTVVGAVVTVIVSSLGKTPASQFFPSTASPQSSAPKNLDSASGPAD